MTSAPTPVSGSMQYTFVCAVRGDGTTLENKDIVNQIEHNASCQEVQGAQESGTKLGTFR
jgi:hypothetical protein